MATSLQLMLARMYLAVGIGGLEWHIAIVKVFRIVQTKNLNVVS